MRYHVLAADYDGTLATHGLVPAPTLAALGRLRASGRKIVLVTGRKLDELLTIFPQHDLCDRIVAENGAVIYRPATKEVHPLAEPPPPAFARELARRIDGEVAVGQVIVATWQPHEATVLELIQEMGLELQIIFNKGAVMILPSGMNKAVGLQAALAELGLSPRSAVGVGDAENDHAFLAICECAVATANALAPLKERADVVTGASHSEGVDELIAQLLRDDLASLEPFLRRHDIEIGKRDDGDQDDGTPVRLSPYRAPLLIAGSSGGGKSTIATVIIEALTERGYQSCIIDPEGDYRETPLARALGDAQRPPSPAEVLALLERSTDNVSVSLIGLPFADRAAYFQTLLPHLLELRARTGRPHWLIVDEAHHVAPAGRHPTGLTLPPLPHNMVFITVRPSQLAQALLEKVDAGIFAGPQAREALNELTQALRLDPAPRSLPTPDPEHAVAWFRADAGSQGGKGPFLFKRAVPETERRRHVRKYATGELGPDKSFYFRGPEKKLNLRAYNLELFLQMGDGVDEATWLHHLRAGDVSQWFRDAIRDPELADEAAAVEQDTALPAAESRQRIRQAIEARYTAAA
jgi:hydroxymethylpyrimidine pyrophosphatase-like HAD family hydrolase